ncbi:MAG: chromate efflux transporter [Betaproteobacteria bacterium]|nr:chromate efflux transporter [Betaproteobacteria bacterium]
MSRADAGAARHSTVLAELAAVFLAFLKLGCTSFGGPIAHLGYLRAEFVERRKWLDDAAYTDLVALCQFLPGPASSQVGIGLGAMRAGVPGALAAWLGFTLPSAALMVLAGYGLHVLHISTAAGWVHGLKLAAVAVVAQAVWGMGRQLCPDRARATIAVCAALLALSWSSALAQILAIAAGGVIGWRLLPRGIVAAGEHAEFGIGRRLSWVSLALFFALLGVLPVLARAGAGQAISVFDSFYRAGSLVFGGGHVVLPLLRAEVVPRWSDDSAFLAGYGLAQALPGPLFTFAAYLGTAMRGAPAGLAGGLLALCAIFLPAFLLVFAALPHWNALRRMAGVRAALNGVNAAVVGILLAALYDPIFTTAVHAPTDFALALAGFALLTFWKLPPLWVVVLAALGGAVIG